MADQREVFSKDAPKHHQAQGAWRVCGLFNKVDESALCVQGADAKLFCLCDVFDIVESDGGAFCLLCPQDDVVEVGGEEIVGADEQDILGDALGADGKVQIAD